MWALCSNASMGSRMWCGCLDLYSSYIVALYTSPLALNSQLYTYSPSGSLSGSDVKDSIGNSKLSDKRNCIGDSRYKLKLLLYCSLSLTSARNIYLLGPSTDCRPRPQESMTGPPTRLCRQLPHNAAHRDAQSSSLGRNIGNFITQNTGVPGRV